MSLQERSVMQQSMRSPAEFRQAKQRPDGFLEDIYVEPEHPLAIALEIMRLYPSYAAIASAPRCGWLDVVADERLQASRAMVVAAVGVLNMARQGATFEELIDAADTCWLDTGIKINFSADEETPAQQIQVFPEFQQRMSSWML